MRKTILAITADRGISETLHSMLSGNFNVITVADGYAALAWMQYGNHADLLIADSDGETVNSYDIKQCIQKLNGLKEIPVVYFYSRDPLSEFFYTDTCIKKPADLMQVVQTINGLMERISDAETDNT